MDLQLIMLAGGLVIVDQSCDAFDPVHAVFDRLEEASRSYLTKRSGKTGRKREAAAP
ncbi:hypothetical protein [Rhodanobacter umsongensis]